MVAVAAVQHPNVIRVHDHGVLDLDRAKRAYFTMDLIEGLPLDVWCRRAAVPVERYRSALPVFREIAAALCAAHETTYLDELGFEVGAVPHGDVKPANVIVDQEGHASLVDFLQLDVQRLIDPGVLSPDLPKVEITGALGTPGFMAPEQERHGVTTVATDIYGLRITFAHALDDGRGSNPISALHRNEGIQGAFRSLVLRMVDARPENRPARVRDVLRELGG